MPDIPWRRDWNLSLFILVIILSFSAPFIIRGGLLSGSLPTRSFEFIDIGIALFLVYLIAIFGKPHYTKIILLVFVGISVFLCQGLFMNWVVAGDLQTDVYNFIGENSNEISSYDYIYFNTSSFIIHRPNSIDESVFYPVARIYYQYIRNDIQALEQRMKNSQQASAGSGINEYDRYFNAKGLDNYALADMLSKQTGKFDNRNYASYLIYGKNMNVPVNVSPNSITFQQDYPGGKNITVDRSRIYEINYEKIYPTS